MKTTILLTFAARSLMIAALGVTLLSTAACGGDDDDSGSSGSAGNAGSAGSSGSAGAGGTAGTAGTGGTSGTAGSGGSAGTSGSAGTAGTGGTAGAGGTAGTAGTGGSAGTGGTAGTGGSAGTAGSSGSSGAAGSAGSAGGNPAACTQAGEVCFTLLVPETFVGPADRIFLGFYSSLPPMGPPDVFGPNLDAPALVAGQPYAAKAAGINGSGDYMPYIVVYMPGGGNFTPVQGVDYVAVNAPQVSLGAGPVNIEEPISIELYQP